MSALDTLADKAQAASERLAREGGVKAKLADELAEDAAFLRKLKPELIKKRAKGQAPTDREPDETLVVPATPAERPRPVQEERKVKKKPSGSSGGGGPNPFLVVGAALVVGVMLAKWIDWRGHAHPKR